MQWKPHSCILTCPEHKFKSMVEILIKFKHICTKCLYIGLHLFTVTLQTEVLRPQGAKGHDRGPITDFATFAYQHTLRSLKLEITETCISSKKRKKMLGPYGGNSIEKDQVDRIN